MVTTVATSSQQEADGCGLRRSRGLPNGAVVQEGKIGWYGGCGGPVATARRIRRDMYPFPSPSQGSLSCEIRMRKAMGVTRVDRGQRGEAQVGVLVVVVVFVPVSTSHA